MLSLEVEMESLENATWAPLACSDMDDCVRLLVSGSYTNRWSVGS
jgi:hypothetical protein